MASTKSTTSTGRSSSSRSPQKKGDDPEVSPARWAGVAFVILAIVAAIVLGVISPSEPAAPAAEAAAETTPVPSPTSLDTRVPTVQPRITNPKEEVTSEVVVPVTVEIPKEQIPRKFLTLLILRGDEILKEYDRPKPDSTVTVEGVGIDVGENALSAVLRGPGGWGPRSETVVVTVDRDAPDLAILSPEDKSQTYAAKIPIELTSEVGALVHVLNETNGNDKSFTMDSNGEHAVTIQLKRGVTNVIEATSTDKAGIPKKARIRVKRLDGRPVVKIKEIGPIAASSLPAKVKISVLVKDAEGKPMKDAEVHYSLGGPDRTTEVFVDFTNANGRSAWNPMVNASSSSAEALELSVTVTSSLSDDKVPETQQIPLK